MNKIIRSLAIVRRDVELAEQTRDMYLEKLQALPLYQSYLEAEELLKEAKDQANQQYEMVANYYVEHFDGENKKPHPAVVLGEYTVVSYDEKDAVQYAVDKGLYPLLSVKKTDFKKIAVTGICGDFVTVTKEVKAKIASDLSGYLD